MFANETSVHLRLEGPAWDSSAFSHSAGRARLMKSEPEDKTESILAREYTFLSEQSLLSREHLI